MNSAEIKEYHDLAFKEKANFLAFINRLGEGGLKKLLKFPGEDFSLWWFSLVAEKSPYKTDCYNNLISFLLSKKIGSEELGRYRKSAKDVLFFQFLLGVYGFFTFLTKILYIKFSMGNFRKRAARFSKSNCVIASYFPYVDDKAAANGMFENKFIGSFHRSLEKNDKDGYSHILIQVFIDDHTLPSAVSLARRFSKKQSIFFIEEFFKVKHLFTFAYYYAWFLIKFVSNLSRIRKTAIYEYEGKRYDIWHLVKCDFYRSFCGENLVTSIWYILLFKEMVRIVDKKAKFVCVCEMQWWERALYIYAKKRGLLTIGYQHSIAPELLLNYFNAKEEMTSGDFIERCPLPDYLTTIGRTPAGLFKKYNWPDERVFVWGAQRFNSLKDTVKDNVSWEAKEDCMVVAFSIDTAEAEKMLAILKEAFVRKPRFRIVLKGHPSQDLKSIAARIGADLSPETFSYTSDNLYDVIRLSKGLIVTESSSCFYALVRGLPIIVPRFMHKIDCNPLSYLTNIPVYVYSPDELARACEKIMAAEPSPDYRERCRTVFNDYLYFPADDNEYSEKIFSIGSQKKIF